MLLGHPEAVEASLAFHCQRDGDQLEAFWDGRMSLRRLWVLLSNLPPSSPLGQKLIGREEYQWTPELRMLASVQEQLQYVAWVIGMVNTDKFKNKKNPVPEPVPIPRPGVEAKRKREAKPGGLVFGAKGESDKPKLQKFFGGPKREE